MSTSMASVHEAPKRQHTCDLSDALAKFTLPPKDLRLLWRSQAKPFEPLHPNAEHILRKVPIPPTLTDHKRIRAFIRSTSITSAGQPFTPQCSEIFPGRLWVADHFSGTDISTLQRLNITHVVCIGDIEYLLSCPLFSTVVHLPIIVPLDTHRTPLVGIIDDTVTLIEEFLKADRAHRVLIHCVMGMDWGPSIATACVMNDKGWCFQSALDFVLSSRHNARLDPMVMEAVQQWRTLETLRPKFPIGRGYREYRWAVEESEEENPES